MTRALVCLLLVTACGSTPAQTRDAGPAEPDGVEIELRIEPDRVVFAWPDDEWLHHRIFLVQGGLEMGPMVVSSGGNEVSVPDDLDWHFIEDLVEGTVQWRLEVDKTYFFEEPVVLGQGSFEVGSNFPGHWDATGITVDGLPTTADVGETIHVTGTVGEIGVRDQAVIIGPSILPESVPLESDGSLEPGASFTMTYTFAEAGLYVVEINEPGGGAIINTPVYVGGTIPLIAHPLSTVQGKQLLTPLALGDMRVELLGYVNEKRALVDRGPLALDDLLNEIAQAKSEDMNEYGYFGHTSPTWGGPGSRAQVFGWTGPLGENISSNSSVLGAHTGLFWSPAHRQNILGESWTVVGFGFARSGDGVLVTENYGSP